MNWTKITIQTTEVAEEMVSAMLLGLGIDQIEIENNLPPSDEDFAAMYIDPQPEILPDSKVGTEDKKSSEAEEDAAFEAETEDTYISDGESHISFYLEEGEASDADSSSSAGLPSDANLASLIKDIKDGLAQIAEFIDIGAGTIEISESREEDWRNNWKKFYKPLLIGDILIKPSWELIPEEYAEQIADGRIKLIEMEPGTAFGTGTHETTRLCVEGLDKYIKPGDAVLDIGTGSGILGLCALSQGASWVMATELDPECEHIILDNLALNNVNSDDRFVLSIGNIIDEQRVRDEVKAAAEAHALTDGFDIIVANILAPVIVDLFAKGQADFFVKKGGYFITSGIIDVKEKSVVEALMANPCWELVEVVTLGEWVSVVARAV